jgi:hypothetical protein
MTKPVDEHHYSALIYLMNFASTDSIPRAESTNSVQEEDAGFLFYEQELTAVVAVEAVEVVPIHPDKPSWQ